MRINFNRDWLFSKDNKNFIKVSLPHTCNVLDGVSDNMFRGITYYTKDVSVNKEDLFKKSYLYFSKAGQQSRVLINYKLVKKYYGGYTPFSFEISKYLKEGKNKITVICDNSFNPDLIPLSADFNFNNGLYGNVYLFKFSDAYFSPIDYPLERFIVSLDNVNHDKASLRIKTAILNLEESQEYQLIIELFDNKKLVKTKKIVLNKNKKINAKLNVNNPHLWNGLDDPFLYSIKLTLKKGDQVIDEAKGNVGLRFFSLDHEKGFFLNGKSYPLRGVAMHQDTYQKMTAMTKEDFVSDYKVINELGCNFVRLAHYPHDEEAYKLCDKLGLVVQTEIPWVNHSGPKASKKYHDAIKSALKDMLKSNYNHPSIIFYGICNELSCSHLKVADPQEGYSSALGIKWVKEFYEYAKKIDSTRYIGFTAHDPTFKDNKTSDWTSDFIALNQYKGWYSGKIEDFGKCLDNYHLNDAKHYFAVGEYGVGNNPFHHSEEPFLTTNVGTGGRIHDEEFANIFHERYLQQIINRPYFIYTAIWILFDFAVASRLEGENPFHNDKGLVTRDRKLRKDVFYLYQATWSKKDVLHITSKRFTVRLKDQINIKVYSNACRLELFENDKLLEVLDSPTDINVVFEFKDIKVTKSRQEFKVVGYFKHNKVKTDTYIINE